MAYALVTGAGRGLGLAFTRQLLERGDTVLAAVRTPAKAEDLRMLQQEHQGRLHIIEMDVSNPESIDSSFKTVQAQTDHLDLLINNAGINSKSSGAGRFESHVVLGELDPDAILMMLRVNSISPLMVAQRYLPLLKSGSRVVSISSWLGSIAGKTGGGNYSYCGSKALLNMFMRTFAFDMRDAGVISVMFNPGWVQTDMGGTHAKLTPTESVRGMLKVLDGVTLEDSGRFFDWNGDEHPW